MYVLIILKSTAYCCMLVLWLLFSDLVVELAVIEFMLNVKKL